MSRILALDTSTDACSVALVIDDQVIERFTLEPRSHARLGLPMVDEVLSEAGIALNSLDAIAFSRGPGSFTGLRIAAGLTQGLAFAQQLPVIPVSTLQALVFGFWREQDSESVPSVLLGLLDARMNEIYAGLYRMVQGVPVLLDNERVLPPELMLLPDGLQDSELAGEAIAVVGSGLEYRDRMPQQTRACFAVEQVDCHPRASAVALLAVELLKQGKAVAAEDAQPVYLRDEVTWQKLPGR